MPTKFTINNDEISERDWGDVDKGSIWQTFIKAREEGASGLASAIKEMYAVVKAPVDENLREADCWGPHHEIRSDGTLVVNRRGVIAAVGALAGARAEPNLTASEKKEAAMHLAKHYRTMGLELPDTIKEYAGEMAVPLQMDVIGEMAVEDIPVAPWADVKSLQENDPNPMEVVVAVPVGKSKRGWFYTEEALKAIERTVNEQGLPGFMGHQKPDDVDHEFPEPVTHWVGAKFENGKLYVRGVIDKSAEDLKRWIKGNAVRTVSIFGVPKLKHKTNGEIEVVDYQPLSIDWTPLGRAGMETQVVAIGEMDSVREETKEETQEETKAGDSMDEVQKVYGELTELLGVEGEELVASVEKMKAAFEEQKRKECGELVEQLIKEKVSGEVAQVLVKKLLKYEGEPDKEKIAGEIDNILNDPDVQEALSKIYAVNPPVVGEEQSSKLVVKRVRI